MQSVSLSSGFQIYTLAIGYTIGQQLQAPELNALTIPPSNWGLGQGNNQKGIGMTIYV